MNEMSLREQNSRLQNCINVFIGALLMAFLWRIRGETGWGSSWGLLNAGFIFTLYIICLMGSRKKLGLGMLSAMAISFLLTTPPCGTIIRQITGTISFEFENIDYTAAYVPIYSAVFLMLCTGFGIAVFYGILLGKSFSGKQWVWWHVLAILLSYYAVMYIAKATVSHGILRLIQPQAGNIFNEGLIKAGHSGSVWSNYIHHFDNKSWAKTIYGGRNYFASIEIVSSFLASVSALLTTRFIVKDKRSSNVGFLVCIAFAIAITVADIFYFFGKGGYHGTQSLYLPSFVSEKEMWEFVTGFIAGGIIVFGIIRLKPQTDNEEVLTRDVPSALNEMLIFLFGHVVLITVNSVRPIMERYKGSLNQIIYMTVAIIVSLIIIIAIAKTCGISVNKVGMRYYASKMLVVEVIHNFLIYMFLGTKDCIAFYEMDSLHTILMIGSFALVTAWAVVNLVRERRIYYPEKNK